MRVFLQVVLVNWSWKQERFVSLKLGLLPDSHKCIYGKMYKDIDSLEVVESTGIKYRSVP